MARSLSNQNPRLAQRLSERDDNQDIGGTTHQPFRKSKSPYAGGEGPCPHTRVLQASDPTKANPASGVRRGARGGSHPRSASCV